MISRHRVAPGLHYDPIPEAQAAAFPFFPALELPSGKRVDKDSGETFTFKILSFPLSESSLRSGDLYCSRRIKSPRFMLGTSGLGFLSCAWLLGRQGHARQGHLKNNNNNKNQKLKKAARITIGSLFSRSAAQNGWRTSLGSQETLTRTGNCVRKATGTWSWI